MFKVQIHKIKNASLQEKKAFRAAALQLELEMNDPTFWHEVAENYYDWSCKKKVTEHFSSGQSFAEFKEMVLSGADKFNPETDHDLDISTTFYYSWSSVVGYTKPSTWLTWANRNVYKGFDLGDIAGNQIHEGLHNMGLGHPGTDRNSVIYQFGYLVRDRIKKRLGLDSTINIYYKRSFFERVKRFFRRFI